MRRRRAAAAGCIIHGRWTRARCTTRARALEASRTPAAKSHARARQLGVHGRRGVRVQTPDADARSFEMCVSWLRIESAAAAVVSRAAAAIICIIVSRSCGRSRRAHVRALADTRTQQHVHVRAYDSGILALRARRRWMSCACNIDSQRPLPALSMGGGGVHAARRTRVR